ncbi:XcbB/CpsF family capsular polysaccharide biosynthesis protein [Paeniglutamicibacter cryotolerans]|uniref:XcbB/CpsF family capsular polysaccharide biosynthesis protein n=1 Tax=Paeniglutamicibacter cryotolerans TaxID=670079 RepID=A0A839QS24_9MICC|nr:XcbB/CpsF family capsular polysaccharide biosynthesis protein [Paeniglutamicibacter cryotolerans]MBB2997475.1 hypothetical protein [Paeniglutamicibacter cryotolerans]
MYAFELSTSTGNAEQLAALDSLEMLPETISCRHEKYDHAWTSLIHVAKKNPAARELLVELSCRGYSIFGAPAKGTRLVHESSLGMYWPELKDGRYSVAEGGVVYSLTEPRRGGTPHALLVVFSAVNPVPFTQSLNRHFTQNWPGLEKSIVDHAAVLRVSDLGGIVGSFYLPTVFKEENISLVQNLITKIRQQLGLGREDVVLYGASKGGTGALLHALHGRYSCVSVDPIVTNDRRETPRKDSYFINTRIFPKTRDEIFKEAVKSFVDGNDEKPSCVFSVITSTNSAEYLSVAALVGSELGDFANLFVSDNPRIKSHADVAPKTAALAMGLMNLTLAKVPVGPGETVLIP